MTNTRELLKACQDSVTRLLDEILIIPNHCVTCKCYKSYVPMLEYLRDELEWLENIVVGQYRCDSVGGKMLLKYARILAHDDPAIKQMLGGKDE